MKKIVAALIITVLFSSNSMAHNLHAERTLSFKRQHVVIKYLTSLANANIEGMKDIFSTDAIVVSTSAGEKNALEYFSGFFPLINQAHTELHQRFHSSNNMNRYSARFHLDYQLADGSKGNGEFFDEFVFYKNSDKLKAVYMFENLKFPTNMKL